MFVFTLFGRGGQGIENTVKILSKTASLGGFHVQSFIFDSMANRGDAILAQVKIDKNYIESRQVEEADFLLVFDKTLDAKNVMKDIKDGSFIIMNSKEKPKIKLKKKAKIFYVNASDIVMQNTNKNIISAPMTGAVAKVFNKLPLRSMKKIMELEGMQPADMACLEQGFKSVKK